MFSAIKKLPHIGLPCVCLSVVLLCQFFAFTVLSEFVIVQRLRTVEGDRWLTLVTGALPAVVLAYMNT